MKFLAFLVNIDENILLKFVSINISKTKNSCGSRMKIYVANTVIYKFQAWALYAHTCSVRPCFFFYLLLFSFSCTSDGPCLKAVWTFSLQYVYVRIRVYSCCVVFVQMALVTSMCWWFSSTKHTTWRILNNSRARRSHKVSSK